MSPSRRRIAYSQNFLRSRRLVDRLLDQSSIGPDDLVVEIGPGRGLITEQLATRCRQVLAIEKDPDLTKHLRARFAGVNRVTIREADFLDVRLPATGYKVFASIPFNITAAIFNKLFNGPHPPTDAYLVVQREAAAKFLGQPRESLSAVLLKPWFEPTLVNRFQRTDFIPEPHVEVVMLRLRKRRPPLIRSRDTRLFRDFVVYMFTAWQPTLRAALGGILHKEALMLIERRVGFDLGRTPTSVPFATWLGLFAAFRDLSNERARRTVQGAEARLRRQQAGLQKVHRTRTPGRAR